MATEQQNKPMFKRGKRIAPAGRGEDEYVLERYQDTSLRILRDIRRGRGLYSSYVPWLQEKLSLYYNEDELRKQRYWLDQVPLYYFKQKVSNEDNQVTRTVRMDYTNQRTATSRSSVCVIV